MEAIVGKIIAAVAAGLILYILSRRESKLSKSIDEQLVFNAKITGAVDLVVEKLNSHKQLTDERHDGIRERLSDLERDVAHRAGRA
jgi:hypothetical protein